MKPTTESKIDKVYEDLAEEIWKSQASCGFYDGAEWRGRIARLIEKQFPTPNAAIELLRECHRIALTISQKSSDPICNYDLSSMYKKLEEIETFLQSYEGENNLSAPDSGLRHADGNNCLRKNAEDGGTASNANADTISIQGVEAETKRLRDALEKIKTEGIVSGHMGFAILANAALNPSNEKAGQA